MYGQIARQSPDRIARIFIRRAEGGDHRDERFAQAFKDVPNEKWTLFDEGKELPEEAPGAER